MKSKYNKIDEEEFKKISDKICRKFPQLYEKVDSNLYKISTDRRNFFTNKQGLLLIFKELNLEYGE